MKTKIFISILFLSSLLIAQPNLTEDSIVVKTSNDTIYVWDYNAWEQCGFQLDYTVEIVDSVITITQIDTAGDMTTCYGYHNFVVPVVNVPEGSYRIDIYRDCLFEDIKFIKSFWFQYPLKIQHVFPLHIGDRWIYWEYPTYYSEFKIENDTVMSNGKLYYDLSSSFYRQKGDSVFRYDPFLSDEYLIFDFSAEVGDTITNLEYGENDTLQIILTYKFENGEYLGVNGTYFTFFINQTQLIDDEISLSVFDSLGIIKRNSTWINESLNGAVIDGVVYGNVTSVEDDDIEFNNFNLMQNFPNPFNPITTINYSLDINSFVRMDIYNILGEKVETLVNEFQNSGNYKVNFNANYLPSGIYFYKLVSNNRVLVNKMSLIK